MNNAVRERSPSSKKIQRSRIETEFRPAALEILEQPQSPIKSAIIWVICLFTLSAVVWSYFGTFDIVATAQGKLQPEGRVKIVQSIEAGRTLSVRVVNGTLVRQGDVVVELDPTDAEAELQAIIAKLSSLRAGIARRSSQLKTLARWKSDGIWGSAMVIEDPIAFAPDIPKDTAERERFAYSSQMEELATNLLNLRAQRAQQKATIDRLEQMIMAQRNLMGTLQQKVSMHSGLWDSRAGTKASLLDAVEGQQQEQANLAELDGQLLEGLAAFETAATEGNKITATFIANAHRERIEALEEAEELEQQRIRAANRLKAMTIMSPTSGIVQATALTTVGQVVASGTELMRIVQTDAPLEVEAYLPNMDIGFVSVGQNAVLKIEAFPFTRYGTVEGIVTAVARDAIPEPDARQIEEQPAKELQSIVPVGNAQRTQNLVFPVTVRPSVSTIDVNGRMADLQPGMAVTIEIKTGKRRILEYLFSPISEVTSQAMQER